MELIIGFFVVSQIVSLVMLYLILKKSLYLMSGFASSNSEALTKLTATSKRREARADEVASESSAALSKITESGERIELAAAEVAHATSNTLDKLAESGQRLEDAAAEVAQDLSNAHARADAVKSGQHGEAADAASRQTEKERTANHNPTDEVLAK
jgi:hypothetical protein